MELQNKYVELLEQKKNLQKQYYDMMKEIRTTQRQLENELKNTMKTNQVTVLPCVSDKFHAVEIQECQVNPSVYNRAAIETSLRHVIHAKMDSDEIEDILTKLFAHLKEQNQKKEIKFKLVKMHARKRWREALDDM